MVDLSSLNPAQLECVKQINGPLVLLAGAGTGKTRVITYRIAHMIASGIAPQKIVALTFTNKAAREMRERIAELCPKAHKELTVGTFHSFCLNQLRRYHKEAGVDKRFGIAGTSDQLELVRKSLEEKSWAGVYHAEKVHAAMGYCKNQLWNEHDILEKGSADDFDGIEAAVIAECFHLYQRQLDLHKHIDFDDCIYRFVNVLRQHPEICEELAQTFQYMLVDEFQDTNFSQLSVVAHLCKPHQNICVVGDDDQSIYSWRGAMAEVLINFEEIFPAAKLVKLEQNYRCTNVVLNAANAVIKNNTVRKEKTLWSEKTATTPICMKACDDDSEEARWIARRCYSLLGKGQKLKDIAILYRANAQSKPLEVALREMNLNYKVFGGQSFFERKEIKDTLAYLKLICEPKNRLAFLRIINTPHRGFGLKTLERLQNLEVTHRRSLYEILKTNPDELPARTHAAAQYFVEGIEKLRAIELNSPEAVRQLTLQTFATFKIEADVRAKSNSSQLADAKIDALRRMPEWLFKMAERLQEEKGSIDLFSLIDRLTLNDTDSKDNNDQGDYISLMSIHASKGLEFPNIFVCGLEDGILPHRNNIELNENISEERRLFYVAMTRTKDLLHLSYAKQRNTGVRAFQSKPSRFIRELPTDLIEPYDEVAEKVSADNRKKRTLGRLSSLKESLKPQCR